MTTQVWFRNPALYIKELVETGEFKIAWDRGLLRKKKIDPIKHAEIYYGSAYPWRVLTIGSQGTAEYRNGDELDKPTAVYPTWNYGDDAELLEEMMAKPVGSDRDICSTPGVPGDELPVFGQEHRVIVCNLPNMVMGPGRAFLAHLKELQEDYPDCILHLHGLYGYKSMFSIDVGAVDVEPRTEAAKGKVIMPSGSVVKWAAAAATPKWVTVLGFKPRELEVPRNRCMYNIKSAVWCGENFATLVKFRVRKGSSTVDTTSATNDLVNPETDSYLSKNVSTKEGDKYLCDTCSLSGECKHFRSGAVCSIPGAEPTELAAYFKTRNAGLIVDGLGLVIAAGARRLERGYRQEQVLQETDPHVTSMQGQVFDQGVKLAKLLDPSLRGGTKIGIQVGSGSAVQINNNPREAVAAAMREFEARGIKREDVTPEMIAGLYASMATPGDRQQAIEATVVRVRDE